jgi:Na+/melibiose symporter-like transporter
MSIYGFAALSRKVGWTGTVVAWTAISLLGTVFCFFMYRPLRKHNLSEENNIQVKTK